MYRASSIKSIQRGVITITNTATTATTTITAVTVGQATVHLLGASGNDSSNLVATCARVELIDSVTVAAYRGGGVSGTIRVGWEVVEFVAGIIKSRQAGTIMLASGGSTTGTATITAVTLAKALLLHLGQNAGATITSGNTTQGIDSDLALTATTTITATRAVNTNDAVVGWCVLEFK